MNKKMSKAKCKYGKPNIIEVGNGEKCLLKGRLCFEVVSTCDILKAYEQGKKDGEKIGKEIGYSQGYLKGNEDGKDNQFELDKIQIRKRTLEKVLIWLKRQYKIMPDYDDRFAFKVYKEYLEQELKKLKELSGEALSTGKSQKRGSKLKEVD